MQPIIGLEKLVPPIPDFWDNSHREESLDRGVYLDREGYHGRLGYVFLIIANTYVMLILNFEDERYRALQVQLVEYI